MENFEKYAPDMIFIEFAVNDFDFSPLEAKVHIESMVRQCLKLKKVPAVVFLYAPRPYEPDAENTLLWRRGVAAKEEIAQHYGLRSINIYDYMLEEYERIKKDKGYQSFTEYLATMYQASGNGFDVHGGYEKYAEAITEALDKDFEGFLNSVPKEKEICCTEDEKRAGAFYEQKMIDDESISFCGDWVRYTSDSPFETEDPDIAMGLDKLQYPFCAHGVMQTFSGQASFGFKTKANAIALKFVRANHGNDAKVYVDGKEAGEFSCNSPYTGVVYITDYIVL